ncbi:electron transfer flavoprotein subunit beta/FixA family protein [Aminipila butyrica]|uniref:Electron transfer flavoprotein small subunit n=1 Tax=Aminipila butyrica TaxID=433296 RepID=A0A858BVZ8_9FIRM|nr:electron transfer flavoprotein subunit beta/FixA family protein [Aminipila butyrica]QIB68904.1 electron transfer flavoprotein subunit beta/FixA family protein [Aminipila butyrica]
MNVIVLIKEVPDMDTVRFDTENGRVDRSSAEAEINPFDLNALQAAVELKEQGATVTVLTMGPPRAEKTVRDAYARGADLGVLLSDSKFGGADTWATSVTLAAGIKKLGAFDLVLCGEKSVDGDTAQVGAEIAEILGIPHAYYVEHIQNVSKDSIQVRVEDICGSKQVRELTLPALISVTKNLNTVQLPEIRRKLLSLNVPITKFGLEDMAGHTSQEQVGLKGSKTKVLKIYVPAEIQRNNRIYRDHFNQFQKNVWAELCKRNLLPNRGDQHEII